MKTAIDITKSRRLIDLLWEMRIITSETWTYLDKEFLCCDMNRMMLESFGKPDQLLVNPDTYSAYQRAFYSKK
jgi:hypothetical protein